jgi:hypothetical protein
MEIRATLAIFPAVLAVFVPMCPVRDVRPTVPADRVALEELWQRPEDIAAQDLFYGPWGADHAPDAGSTFTFVKAKTSGMNPGMTVIDQRGRTWSIKQAHHDRRWRPEGPVEVVLSRVLSAVGYHQPPVYYLPSFTLRDTFGSRTEPGGRFRLDHDSLKDRGSWSWQRNPFVATRPYQGLLVILMMFNSSDLKESNNTLYEIRGFRTGPRRWFVVRDLGISLGGTGRVSPPRSDPDLFERHGFITGTAGGYVAFEYAGYHAELIRGRITADDVRWAGELLGRLTDRQWRDAFRAGGYPDEVAIRFIRRLQEKVAQARSLEPAAPVASASPVPGGS